jgi:FAD/FMN-containing dehydrogenase
LENAEADERAMGAMVATAAVQADPAFKKLTTCFNTFTAKVPKMVARVCGLSDVQQVLQFAREHKLPFSLKCGGHGAAGGALCNGVVIDFSLMRTVTVDLENMTAHVDAGCRIRDVDEELAAHGCGQQLISARVVSAVIS